MSLFPAVCWPRGPCGVYGRAWFVSRAATNMASCDLRVRLCPVWCSGRPRLFLESAHGMAHPRMGTCAFRVM